MLKNVFEAENYSENGAFDSINTEVDDPRVVGCIPSVSDTATRPQVIDQIEESGDNVYDTIGSSKVENGSFFRDDDWSIDGKNNSLSFPSYYIDENAITCLDGDGCKIRNGLASIEEGSGLDTSIACDSCDIWYHALGVGFDTEGIVSISIVDTGETAVVVSMVDRNKWVPETNERGLCPLEVDGDRLTESCSLMSDTNNQPHAAEKTTLSPIMKVEELEFSLSHSTSRSSMHNDLKKIDNGTR
ncbi:hypothetical protein KIW84_042881 [Lathyrus oleraceus]|uniref:Uncharacterized protein n=1 Tax=Pisum sativum TaxID=3888 RepID=A0A9D4XFQ6_PEA|nr:hypothetical protein KIW84_042881 [Pisum sativum]